MLAIALIPCIGLLAMGSIVVVNLSQQARSARGWAQFLNNELGPIVAFATAAQDERTVSLAALAGDPQAIATLPARRATMDAAMAEVARLAPEVTPLSPQAMTKSTGQLMALAPKMPLVRQAVDSRHATAADVDGLFSGLVGIFAVGLDGLAHYTPDSLSAAEEMTAADVVRMADLHSRATGIANSMLLQGTLGIEDRREVGLLVGGYRSELDGLMGRFSDADLARVRQLTTSPQWGIAFNAQNDLVQRGRLGIPVADWQRAEQAVNEQFMGLFRDHLQYANTMVTDAAQRAQNKSITAAIGVGAIDLVALVFAVFLANGLIRRLRSLRTGSLHLANETLPSIIGRLHEGEQVDIDAEATVLDTGADEIGQVAEAFATAQRTAMAAAADEARMRDGFNKVFVDIAYRSQVIVRRQMDVLDVAESKQQDPEHLELLFRLDHLATRARRNAENLLILGGSQPGRRWHQPVPLEQIVRSAASETQDMARLSAIRLPSTHVQGNAVADLIHLLAELIDNAASFSPPQTHVSVHGNVVGRGVVVLIEDQGLGIGAEECDRLNELLRNPPDFQAITSTGQRQLGLFVVGRLSRRHNISVTLQESAYGGVKAIVLIPSRMLDPGSPGGDIFDPALTAERAEADSPLTGLPRPVTDPVPRLPRRMIHPDLHPSPVGPTAELPAGDRKTEVFGAELKAGGTKTGPFEKVTVVEDRRPDQSGRSRAPLPRRQRFSHLVPELMDEESPDDDPRTRQDQERSAEDRRNSMASFQRGTREARMTEKG